MYDYQDIRKVHLEITQRCNAGCPMCGRHEEDGSVNRLIRNNLQELTLEDCKSIFQPEFIQQLEIISFCGNLGDPIVARDTLEVCQYLRQNNPDLHIMISTNGGARSTQWWKELAGVLGENGEVKFAIDGLSDTNHIYRRGVDWDVVMRNAQAFIDAGGEAEWHYLIFEHNEHQVDQAKKLSQEMGFLDFKKKKSSRFTVVTSDGELKDEKIKVAPVNKKQKQQAAINTQSTIKTASKKVYKSKIAEKQNEIIKNYGSMKEYHNTVKIDCKVVKDRNNVYVNADGTVMPCCWVAHTRYDHCNPTPESRQIDAIIDDCGGIENIDARVHGLRHIFETGIMRKIQATWKLKSTSEGRMIECAKRCGTELDLWAEQFKIEE